MQSPCAYRSFGVGLGIIVLAAVMTSLLSGLRATDAWAGVGNIPFWFVLWSLLALTLGNREIVRRETGARGGRYWGTVLVASMAGVMLLGLLFGAVSIASVLDTLQTALILVLLALALLVGAIFSALAWLISAIFPFHFGPYKKDDKAVSNTPSNMFDQYENWKKQVEQMHSQPLSPDLQAILTWTAAFVALVAVVLLVLYISRRLRRTRSDRTKALPEDRESFASWALLQAQLLAWWRSLLARFSRRQGPPQAAAADDLAALRANPDWQGPSPCAKSTPTYRPPPPQWATPAAPTRPPPNTWPYSPTPCPTCAPTSPPSQPPTQKPVTAPPPPRPPQSSPQTTPGSAYKAQVARIAQETRDGLLVYQ